ncbi:XRE family transcriptional regulator [Dysgonomonas sp. 216]|uniref:helix-turn-helix domain-containing protein n=1 Tax=Dysgonomonas sp. 216 TaxID=2302934 RepID=UPI0013D52EE1|nr:XRE family transcriptional regulator [Dysgonomonas sp. 216]NDW19262.1 XRE family transcriptional regulator [Dysgonomonas sp. 216]
MKNELRQIGLRLKGLRDAFDLTPEEFAASCEIPINEYLQYEAGEKDFSISLLKSIASKYNVELSALMFDDEPRMNSYFITRKDKGLAIERVKEYNYESLAAGFNNKKADIFMVTVEAKPDTTPIHISTHEGQEFNMVMEGSMLLRINGKDVILNTGDSIYFDSSMPHGMKALDNKRVRFLAVVF